ncbi:MAG: hypothetical protein J5761_01500 [Paludibacteraceae bacterium]|nr:hypothetical protein [Paludibacteraceae bacterium]
MKKRLLIDRVLRTGIKLCMLTGVAFTMAACYGPPPEGYRLKDEPEFKNDQQQLQQRLVEQATNAEQESEEK